MDLKEIFNNSTTKDNIKNIDKDSRTAADIVEEIDAKRLYDALHPEFENKKDKFLYYSVVLFFLILCSPLFLLDKIDDLSDKIGKWVNKIYPDKEYEIEL
ncbi:MAG: hypothetical protein J6M30_05690 [Bacteroidales bacterium]|nr:hypothetical protein [Bacteroidales bacterium]